jgi:phage/plasmid-associated DNA primase
MTIGAWGLPIGSQPWGASHLNYFSVIIAGGIKSEHKFFNFYGPERNGKSALIPLYENALGTKLAISYCPPANIKLITTNDTKLEGTNSSVMACRGALLATMTEPAPGESLAVEVVKRLSGDDIFTGNRRYEVTQKLLIGQHRCLSQRTSAFQAG